MYEPTYFENRYSTTRAYTDTNQLGDPLGDDTDAYIEYVLRQEPCSLKFSTDRVKESRKFVEIAVSVYGPALQYAAPLLKDDEDIVMAAVTQDYTSIVFATSRVLRSSTKIWRTAIKINPSIILSKHRKWGNDLTIIDVLLAVRLDSSIYEDIDDRWKEEKRVAFAAVTSDWSNIFHVPEPHRHNCVELLKIVLRSKGWQYQYQHDLQESLWLSVGNNDALIEIGALRDCRMMRYASEALLTNEIFNGKVASRNGEWLQSVHCKLKKNSHVLMSAVLGDGMHLQYVPDEFKNDTSIVMAAVSGDGMALQFASEALRADRDIVHIAVHNSGQSIQYTTDAFKNEKALVLKAVSSYGRHCGEAFKFVSDTMKLDLDVIRLAVRTFPGAMNLVQNDDLKGDVDLVCLAIQRTIQRSQKGLSYLPVDLDWIDYRLLSFNVSKLTTSDVGFVDTGCSVGYMTGSEVFIYLLSGLAIVKRFHGINDAQPKTELSEIDRIFILLSQNVILFNHFKIDDGSENRKRTRTVDV